MFSAIYVEEELKGHARVSAVCARYPDVPVVYCQRYGEVFNRKAQDFRIQKQAPALILARKHGKRVLPAPAGYGFEEGEGYYFSHMLNCLYDCRYCFLQGMYRSAHYVLFVNYEDFAADLEEHFRTQKSSAVYYSGYDCDSLALEPVSGFCDYFLPLFARYPDSILEIRTKSTQVRALLEYAPLDNCVVAMSFTSVPASERWEHKVPSVEKRLESLRRLQEAGWKVALRFEPVVAEQSALQDYQQLFERVFSVLDAAAVHSVSLGEFRMPADFYKNIVRQFPDETLYARAITVTDGMVALSNRGDDLMTRLEASLHEFIEPQQFYRCA